MEGIVLKSECNDSVILNYYGSILLLCSVIGAAVIALGFYAVIWGQAQEDKTIGNRGVCCSESCSPKVPLLQNKGLDI